ncbi:AraC family transcriptional regulator [Parashewanella curva]|uniref:AraC family transcriptional regulator n=1 Tax=Parashewanella curva TaxID=2338552 RepID=A0A3L8PX88_9GAMM|nr:AraC family transcriptional regulator [Parashewanella curva]RLV59243.1 AraC family transcriptional regulator [Parashewanella curva]
MQLLEQVLKGFHLNSTVFHLAKACHHWSTDTSGSGKASFHFISSGQAYVAMEEHEGIHLNEGDIVIFPHDAKHQLKDSPTTPDTTPLSQHPITSSQDGTGLVCGYFDLAEDARHPLIQQLPTMLLIRQQDTNGSLKFLLQSLITEAEHGLAGQKLIVEKLSESFFLLLLRQELLNNQDLGYVKATLDPKMNKVMTAIESDLSKPWSLEQLASIGGYSRANLAKQFKQFFNRSVMDYVIQLRMSLAQKQLRQGKSVWEVALNVGYQNDASFAKAYKNHFGVGPGRSREKPRGS